MAQQVVILEVRAPLVEEMAMEVRVAQVVGLVGVQEVGWEAATAEVLMVGAMGRVTGVPWVAAQAAAAMAMAVGVAHMQETRVMAGLEVLVAGAMAAVVAEELLEVVKAAAAMAVVWAAAMVAVGLVAESKVEAVMVVEARALG